MARGICSDCGHASTDISIRHGGRCPICRERLESEREAARRGREREFHAARREYVESTKHDQAFEAAMRRLDLDDPISVRHLYGFALQRSRYNFAEQLLAFAQKNGWNTNGWEKMIDRLN